jgi:hypothetical protein
LDRQNAGLLLLPGPLTLANREGIVALAARARLPAIYRYRFYVTSGGLMSYGVDTAESYRRAAVYVDRILKGEKPPAPPQINIVSNAAMHSRLPRWVSIDESTMPALCPLRLRSLPNWCATADDASGQYRTSICIMVSNR